MRSGEMRLRIRLLEVSPLNGRRHHRWRRRAHACAPLAAPDAHRRCGGRGGGQAGSTRASARAHPVVVLVLVLEVALVGDVVIAASTRDRRATADR